MNHSVQVLVSEKYGKHLYVGRKKHTNINVSRIELKALSNCKPYKKLRGHTPFIQTAIPVAAVLLKALPSYCSCHLFYFTSPKSQIFPFDHIQSKNQERKNQITLAE